MSDLTVTCKVSFRTCRRGRSTGPPREKREHVSLSRAPLRLALAHRIEQLIELGQLDDYAHAARVLGVSRARLSQLMDLILLAPDIQEAVLTGTLRTTERKLRLAARNTDWALQRRSLNVCERDPEPPRTSAGAPAEKRASCS